MAKAIPDGYHTVTPYLICKDAGAALKFYEKAFGAKEVMRLVGPGGVIGHAEMEIGNSKIMLADEFPDMKVVSPISLGGTPTGFCIYVDDVDTAFQKAIDAGGTLERPVVDQFYGDRSGTLLDPFGHKWTLATHKEDVPPEEMQRRMDEFMKKM